MNLLKSFSLCLGLALVAPALAPNAAGAMKAKLRLLAYAGDQEAAEVFLHDPAADADSAPVQYEIRGFLNSESVTVPLKTRKVVFTLAKERESMTNAEQLLGEAELVAGSDSAIVLFLPAKPGGNGKCKVVPIADSLKAFPPGSFQVTNLTDSNFKLQLEDKSFEFKAGETGLIANPPTKADSSQMGMRGFIFKDDAWKEFSSSIWSHPGKARSIMILSEDPAGGQIRFRSFDDVEPSAEAEPAGKKGRKKSKSK